MRNFRPVIAALFAIATLAVPAGADVVIDWNNQTLEAIRKTPTPPPPASRALAMVHVAIYDAVNGITKLYTPYHVTAAAPAGADPVAAAAQAAHDVLAVLYPARLAILDQQLATSLAGVADGPGKTAGIAWGKQVAQDILDLRATDGATPNIPYESLQGAGWWVPTGPLAALLPQWPNVKPWAMDSGSQFRSGPPPPPNSAEYTAAFREVARFGRVNSTFRSPDQTQIALFWADGPGTATPPGHWFRIAQDLPQANNLTLTEHARLFALLGMVVADAAVVSWDNKYHYGYWRPVTGIHEADHDGNPDTAADPGWAPLITTPPFPTYTSGHSTFSGGSSELLALFFGSDQIAFDSTVDSGFNVPNVTIAPRHFASFSAAAEEAGQSRVYGGIHWQFDNGTGLAGGRALAEHVFYNFLRPVVTAAVCVPGDGTLCLSGGRFKVEASWATADSAGAAHAESVTSDSGRFWFFDAANTELLVKIVDACAASDHFWVFASGLTNVEVVLTVTDSQTGEVRTYFNPRGRDFAPVLDTNAFATCP